ncbi:MAG: RNA polymerase sigma factor RpoD, partial [Ruminiclostridium sp.]|nr:RNA polymerase sigma factor RpoD [Ruminiclostridium sp.]
MSEKKAQDNKRDKGGKLIHVTEEQIQAGKAELLKIVAGNPGAEKLAETLEKSKKKGRMVASDIMEALEEVALDSEQMDKIYDILENMGIDTSGEAYLPDLTNDDGMPPLEEIEEIPEEEIVDPNTLVDSFGIDDPVRMYLKE